MSGKAASERKVTVSRTTKETDISVTWNIDGRGSSSSDTGIPFMDHMLDLFAKHGIFDLEVKAKGDIKVDFHHTIEDLGIVMGECLAKGAGGKAGIRRYGWCALPMDEALALVSLDLSGRPCLVYDFRPPAAQVGGIDSRLFHEFFQAFSNKAGMTLHIRLMSGEEIHHCVEAVFKAFAKALSQALSYDPRSEGVPSTKGVL